MCSPFRVTWDRTRTWCGLFCRYTGFLSNSRFRWGKCWWRMSKGWRRGGEILVSHGFSPQVFRGGLWIVFKGEVDQETYTLFTVWYVHIVVLVLYTRKEELKRREWEELKNQQSPDRSVPIRVNQFTKIYFHKKDSAEGVFGLSVHNLWRSRETTLGEGEGDPGKTSLAGYIRLWNHIDLRRSTSHVQALRIHK